MSEAKKGQNNPMFGKTFSEETKAKMSAAQKGKTFSEETKAKISLAQPKKKIEVTDLELDTLTTYNSMGEAAKALNIQKPVISMYFKRNQIKPFKGRYVFRKI